MNIVRSRIRLAHIGIAAFTAGVVYSPSFDASTVRDLLRVAVLPALALTGAALWALPRLRRRATSRSVLGPTGARRARSTPQRPGRNRRSAK